LNKKLGIYLKKWEGVQGKDQPSLRQAKQPWEKGLIFVGFLSF